MFLPRVGQAYFRDVTPLFRQYEFDLGFTFDFGFGHINSGVMFVRQASQAAIDFWTEYVAATEAERIRLGSCHSGSNQMALQTWMGDNTHQLFQTREIKGAQVIKIPQLFYNNRFVSFGPAGSCDLDMYSGSAVFHAPGTSKFVPARCSKELLAQVFKIHPQLAPEPDWAPSA